MAKVRIILASLLALLFCSCERDGTDLTLSIGPYGDETRKVMLLYEAGFNSLGGDIANNIRALQDGYLPEKGRNDDVLLVFSHVTKSMRKYTVETAPSMVRLYSEHGEPRADTLKVWPVGTSVANAAMVTEVFDWVRETFPAAGYGAVMSSHATGWLPEDYFNNSKKYEGSLRGNSVSWSPRMRTFGQEYYSSGSKVEEIEIKDLAAAIPYKLDYILFDACLMATVEVAWELRNVCDYLAVSPCEIPAAGFNYKTLAGHLLEPDVPDLEAVCKDYYAAYENNSTYGATITMLDCSRLDPLASACRTLFERYRSGILNLTGRNVQVYDRIMGDKGFYAFFDIKDVLREAGASAEDLDLLQEALDEAIVYEAHTPRFIDVTLKRCCGLSMYLPAYPDYRKDIWHGTKFLDTFYKENVSWNTATSLVE
jgi:Clostripain family.